MMTIEKGSVVRSIAGHDADRFYVVLEMEGISPSSPTARSESWKSLSGSGKNTCAGPIPDWMWTPLPPTKNCGKPCIHLTMANCQAREI